MNQIDNSKIDEIISGKKLATTVCHRLIYAGIPFELVPTYIGSVTFILSCPVPTIKPPVKLFE